MRPTSVQPLFRFFYATDARSISVTAKTKTSGYTTADLTMQMDLIDPMLVKSTNAVIVRADKKINELAEVVCTTH